MKKSDQYATVKQFQLFYYVIIKYPLHRDTVLKASAAAALFVSMYPVLITVPGTDQDFK